MRCFDSHVTFKCFEFAQQASWMNSNQMKFLSASKHHTFKKSCFNFWTVFSHRKDNKDLVQCPTPGCDGMGHSSGNYSTHRRYVFGMIYKKNNKKCEKKYLFYSLSGCPRSTKPKSRPKDGPEAETLRYDLFQIVTLMKIWDKFSILNDLFLILN